MKNTFKNKACLSFTVLFVQCITLTCYPATYYSRTSGNWNDNNSWSTTGYGQATNAGTFPKSGDIALIGDGYTILVNTAVTIANLTIGQGSSGILEFTESASYTFSVTNSVTVSTGAKCWYNGNSARTHILQVGTNLVNNGTVDLYSDADDVVSLVFYRTNGIVSGTGTWSLSNVTLSKNSAANSIDIQSTNFEAAVTDLILTTGIYIHNNLSSYTVNPLLTQFNVPADATFRITKGSVTLSPSQDSVILQGTIQVYGGTMYAGKNTGTGGIFYDKLTAVIPKLEIQGGSLTIYGGINPRANSSADPFRYQMDGGTLTLNSGSTGTASSVFNINNATGSVFSMSDGAIIIQSPNTTGTNISDFQVCGTTGTVTSTGGIITFGNVNTADDAQFTFTPYTGKKLPALKVSGVNNTSLQPVDASMDDIVTLSLTVDAGMSFNLNSTDHANDGRSLVLYSDGVSSMWCDGTFNSATGTVVFNGTDPAVINGSATIDFNNVVVDVPSGLEVNTAVNINGTLDLTDGIVTTAMSVFTLKSTATCESGSSASYINGPLTREVNSTSPALLSFPLGAAGEFRQVMFTVTQNTATTTDYTLQWIPSSPRNLGYTLPVSLDKISNVRYLSMISSAPSTFNSGIITMNYDADDGVEDFNSLRIAAYTGGQAWKDFGGVGTNNTSGEISSSSFSTFPSIITFGNLTGGSNPLPLTLVSFDVKQQSKEVQLSWNTVNENNVDFFLAEQSTDLIDFRPVANVKALNTLEKHQYSVNVKSDMNPVTYYRLRITDFDGSYIYSEVKAVKHRNEFTVYPNPSSGGGFYISSVNGVDKCILKLTGADGSAITYKYIFQGNNTLFIEPDMDHSGVLLFSISEDDYPTSGGIVVLNKE